MTGDGGSPIFLIILGLAIVALLFMSSRTRKRQAQATAFRNTLAPGQRVMTSSGMFGTVTAVTGDRVTLTTAGGQESEWLLQAIARLEEEPETTEDADDADDAVPDGTGTDDLATGAGAAGDVVDPGPLPGPPTPSGSADRDADDGTAPPREPSR